MTLDEINNTLQAISTELKEWEVSAYIDKLDDVAYNEFVTYMENLRSAYSYCEE